MLSWQVGAVKVTRIVEIEIPVAYYAKYPFMKDATPEALKAIETLHGPRPNKWALPALIWLGAARVRLHQIGTQLAFRTVHGESACGDFGGGLGR